MRRDGSGFVRYYPASALELVRAECERRRPPEGLLTVAEIAELLGLEARQVGHVIRRLGVAGVEALRRDNGGLARYYDQAAVEAVRAYEEASKPPVGLLDIHELTEAAGCSRMQAKKALKELGVQGQEGRRRDGRGLAHYYAPEVVGVLRAYFAQRKPPAGFVSADQLAEEAGVSKTTVTRTVKRLGVEPAFGGGSGVKAYFSPEQRLTLLAELGVEVEAELQRAA